MPNQIFDRDIREESFDKSNRPFESGDGFDYERWAQKLEILFSFLGVVRSLSEGKFSDEERLVVVGAIDSRLQGLDVFPPEGILKIKEAFSKLVKQDSRSLDFLLESFGNSIRLATQKVKEKAPTLSECQATDLENGYNEDDPNLIHKWLEKKEAWVIANKISKLLEAVPSKKDTILSDLDRDFIYMDAFSAIGDLQRLIVLVARLRGKIDDEEIEVGDRTAEMCAEQVGVARDMLVRAMYSRTSPAANPPYGFDLNKIDLDILNNAADIAGWLGPVEMWSV